MSTFGEKIRRLRLDRHFSQQRVANDLGLSQSAIAAYEGGINEPSFKTISTFASYFNVSPVTLVPFELNDPDEEIKSLAEIIAGNKKLKVLFDRTSSMSDSDLDAVIGVVRAISKESDADD